MSTILNYDRLMIEAKEKAPLNLTGYLKRILPEYWAAAYRESVGGPTNLLDVQLGPFLYFYDWHSYLEDTGKGHSHLEDRLIAVVGNSTLPARARERSRIRGWGGPTEESLGKNRDKGHFMAYSFGGRVDHCEINLFSQSRTLNRGWSAEGKQWRKMEEYCQEHQNTFCFVHAIYSDASSCPSNLEFGILKSGDTLDVKRSKN